MGGEEKSKKDFWQIAESYKEELIKRITEKISSIYGKNEISQNNSPESFIFVSEAVCPGEKQFVPIVSDWLLSEDKEKGKLWTADPHPDPQTGTWDVEIIQTAKKAEIPEPTFKGDQFTSIFTQQTFSRDQLEQQIQQHGLRQKIIAVAYHNSKNELSFRKPTEEEKQNLEKSQDRLTKCVYLNNDQEFQNRMDATLKNKDLSDNQKLISYITNQATSQLFKEIDQNERTETAREIKDLISQGTGMFLLKNILLTKWDPQQKKPAAFQETDKLEHFPFIAELPLSKVSQQLEAAMDSTLQEFKNLFNLLGPQNLEPFMILHPREIAEPEIKANSLKTIIIKAEDAIYLSEMEPKTRNRKEEGSPYIEFLTDNLLANIRKGRAEAEDVDREARKKNMAKNFGELKKILLDDGILAVLCEEGHGEIVEDVQESLKEAGFEVEGDWEIEKSGNEKGKWERVVVGRKGMGKKVNGKISLQG
jgi:hypothetical protein